jgi:hypothetical protein
MTVYALKTCPVLSVAMEYDALAERSLHLNSKEIEMEQVLGHRLAGLAMAASELTPTSREGAAFQIMLMAAEVDTIPGGADGSQVHVSKDTVRRLAYRSLDGMRDEISKFPNAKEYMMPNDLDPRA